MWKIVEGSKILSEYFSKYPLKTSFIKEESKSTVGEDCLPYKWHGSCWNHTLHNEMIPKHIHEEITKIIKSNNKEVYEFKYNINILKYTFDTNEYIYNLYTHEDNNYQTIIIYLDKYNVTDIFYIVNDNTGPELINSDVMWKDKSMLIMGKDKTKKNLPKHGGLFMKQDRSKSGYRKILSIFVGK